MVWGRDGQVHLSFALHLIFRREEWPEPVDVQVDVAGRALVTFSHDLKAADTGRHRFQGRRAGVAGKLGPWA